MPPCSNCFELCNINSEINHYSKNDNRFYFANGKVERSIHRTVHLLEDDDNIFMEISTEHDLDMLRC